MEISSSFTSFRIARKTRINVNLSIGCYTEVVEMQYLVIDIGCMGNRKKTDIGHDISCHQRLKKTAGMDVKKNIAWD